MKLIALLSGVILSLPAYVSAESETDDKGWFVGAAIGATSYSETEHIRDDSDSFLSLNGGYRFGHYFAIQGGYFSLGEYAGDEDVLISEAFEGINITAVGIYPLEKMGLDLFGRAGLGRMRYEQSFDFLGSTSENTSTGDVLVTSLGVAFSPFGVDSIDISVAYENYFFKTNKVYVEAKSQSHTIGVAAVGAKYSF